MAYQFGDVVLVPFPFTDQSTSKQRPAVIVSNSTYHQSRRDVVLMAITSQLQTSNALNDTRIHDWQAAQLLKPSAIKPVFATLEQYLVIRTLGRLSVRDSQALKQTIGKILG